MSEELAFIKGIGFGLRDTNQPCLWFDARTLTGGALQCLFAGQIVEFVREAGVYDIKNLEGAPCVVSREGNSLTFVKLHK